MPRKTAPKPQVPAAAPKAEAKKPARAKTSAAPRKPPVLKAKAAAAAASATAAIVAPFDPEAHHEEIRHQAYLFSLERSGASADPQDDWFRAEAEIRRRWKGTQSGD